MKRKQFIIPFAVILLFFCFFFYYRTDGNNENKEKKVTIKLKKFITKTVDNTFIEFEITQKGEILKQENSKIRFAISGELLDGQPKLEEGQSFQKNQLLFRLNNLEAFSTLAAKKVELAQLLESLLPQIESKFENNIEKWKAFLDEIKPIKRLPEIVSPLLAAESSFLEERHFMQAYVKIKMLESEMEKYFYLAPFDGRCVKLFVSSGKKISPESTIALISKDTKLLSKFTIKKEKLDLNKKQKNIQFWSENGEEIAKGEFLRSSKINDKSDSLEVFYSLYKINESIARSDTRVKITFKQKTTDKCIAVPFCAINGNIVRVLVNELPVSKTITIIGKTENHYLISGLADGEKLILKKI